MTKILSPTRRTTHQTFYCALATLVMAAGLVSRAIAQPAPEYGPAKGTLLIVGGGQLDSSGIIEKFIALAGGPSAKIIIVPTAGGNRKPDGTPIVYEEAPVLASWKKYGLTNLHMLHTADPKVADTDEFASMLRDARAVWFVGAASGTL
ncbi:MAG: hypothetical protein IPP90_10920 [Gemmatimonadaceae bacterium]|nr:hypothetical protein [Gemmatimonadaceae bacterium]